MDVAPQQAKISVQEIKGVNERRLYNSNDIGELDYLRNAVPTTEGALTRINGIKLLLTFPYGESILNMCQTNDSRGNIIVQTNLGVYYCTPDEIFATTPYVPSLTPVSSTEEENMSQALLAHTTTSGTAGATLANNTNWQQRPLSSIVSQVNPDGSTAAFVTLLSNQFTLAAGVYRIRGWAKGSVAALTTKMRTRLYNITGATPAWNGAANENSDEGNLLVAAKNMRMEFGGYLNLTTSTIFEVQQKCSVATSTSTFGQPASDGSLEVYAWLEILKTA